MAKISTYHERDNSDIIILHDTFTERRIYMTNFEKKPLLIINKNYFVWFAVAIFLNAFGNTITIISALGTGPWIALSENISSFFGILVGTSTIIIQVVLFICACFLNREFSYVLVAKSVAISMTFGFLVDFFIMLSGMVYIPVSVVFRVILFIFGVVSVLIGVSIYIRLNIALMPFDMVLRALMLRLGSVKYASMIFLSVPIVLALLLSLLNGELVGVGIGTMVCLVINPYLLDFFEKAIFIERQL